MGTFHVITIHVESVQYTCIPSGREREEQGQRGLQQVVGSESASGAGAGNLTSPWFIFIHETATAAGNYPHNLRGVRVNTVGEKVMGFLAGFDWFIWGMGPAVVSVLRIWTLGFLQVGFIMGFLPPRRTWGLNIENVPPTCIFQRLTCWMSHNI